MNNSFSLQEKSETGNFDANLSLKQYKLDLTERFMEIKFLNPKLRHDQKASQLGLSNSTLQRYRNKINMPSPHRVQNRYKKRQNIPNMSPDDVQRRQMTSTDLK